MHVSKLVTVRSPFNIHFTGTINHWRPAGTGGFT
jgi:hypothetical protein